MSGSNPEALAVTISAGTSARFRYGWCSKRCLSGPRLLSGSFHWLPLCCCRPSWCRRNRHLHRKVVPKINILGKPLSDVGYPHYFSVQANGFDIATLTRRGELGIRPQDQHITYGQKHTKTRVSFIDFIRFFIMNILRVNLK